MQTICLTASGGSILEGKKKTMHMPAEKKGDRMANQTGSQSGNPENQGLQRDQDKGTEKTSRSRDREEPRRRRSNSSGTDHRHGGNR